MREVILRNGCRGLSPLDIKSLDTNVNNNNNEKKSVPKTLQILSSELVA